MGQVGFEPNCGAVAGLHTQLGSSHISKELKILVTSSKRALVKSLRRYWVDEIMR
jgi:hypothetical protein